MTRQRELARGRIKTVNPKDDSIKMATAALELIEARQGEMLRQLQTLVELESPSGDKAAVDVLGAHLLREFESMGGHVTIRPAVSYGDHLQVDFDGNNSGGKPVLLLGHFDTVWEMGTLRKMPFRLEKGRAFGPGPIEPKK